VNRAELAEIDLHWHDLRHEAACRWLARGLDLESQITPPGPFGRSDEAEAANKSNLFLPASVKAHTSV
jgi:hypothetical protein